MIYKFGKYPRWYTTSGLESKWLMYRYGDRGLDLHESKFDEIDHVVIGTLDGIQRILNKTINRYNEWRGQKVRVHVENHDIWSADATIAHMVLPLLEKLRDEKHGYPLIDPKEIEGLPKELKPKKKEAEEYSKKGLPDPKAEARWNWVLNEMIFAMECIIDNSWEDEFFGRDDPDDMLSVKMIDKEGYDNTHKRIDRGLRFFGLWFRALWD